MREWGLGPNLYAQKVLPSRSHPGRGAKWQVQMLLTPRLIRLPRRYRGRHQLVVLLGGESDRHRTPSCLSTVGCPQWVILACSCALFALSWCSHLLQLLGGFKEVFTELWSGPFLRHWPHYLHCNLHLIVTRPSPLTSSSLAPHLILTRPSPLTSSSHAVNAGPHTACTAPRASSSPPPRSLW